MVTLSGVWMSCVGPLEKTKGGPSGQHWLRGFGSPMPATPSLPCSSTTLAAAGFRIGFLYSPLSFRMSPVPFSRRERLTSDVGPDLSASKPGLACWQMPDKSGMDFALSLAPIAGVTQTAASVSTKGKFRRKSIALLLVRSAPPEALAQNYTLLMCV